MRLRKDSEIWKEIWGAFICFGYRKHKGIKWQYYKIGIGKVQMNHLRRGQYRISKKGELMGLD